MFTRPPRRSCGRPGSGRSSRSHGSFLSRRKQHEAAGVRDDRPGHVDPYGPGFPTPLRPGAPHAPWTRPKPSPPAHPRRTGEPARTAAPAHPAMPAEGRGPSPARNLSQFGTMQLPIGGVPSNIHCLTIIGQIEGHLVLPPQNKTTKYEHSIPQLVAIELNPAIEGLLVVLNTVGGDVEAGLAIAEMIASLSKPKVSLVVGGGHSIGVPIAVAADRSYITHTATMTIHPIRLSGLVIGVPQTYEYLDKMQDRVVKFIVANSRISEQRFRDLMFRTGELARDVGTVLVGHDAVRIGLIDEVGGLEKAIGTLKGMIAERKLPPAAADGPRRTFDSPQRRAGGYREKHGYGLDAPYVPQPGLVPGPGPDPQPAPLPDPQPEPPDDYEAPGPWLPGPETWGRLLSGPRREE